MNRFAALAAVSMCALVVVAPTAAGRQSHAPAPTPMAHDALARALERGQLSEAQYAWQRARSLFRLDAVRREFGDVARPAPGDATLILRDLVLRYRSLSPAERPVARALLARPTDNTFRFEHHYPGTAIVASA